MAAEPKNPVEPQAGFDEPREGSEEVATTISARGSRAPGWRRAAGAQRPPPVTLDRFELEELLGAGGMGRVYRAHDREMQREVALKTLHHLDSDEVLQLKTEFRSLADVTHPNLAQLYELFVDGDNCFFSMELVQGTQPEDYVLGSAQDRTSAWSGRALSRLARVTEQLCHGLEHLHSCGRLHRDLKPSNVLVRSDGRVSILDFGLVTSYGKSNTAQFGTPMFAGTLPYMAPEQAWGLELTPAVDCYALGVLLYELIGGRLPFVGSPTECLTAKQALRVEPLSSLVPDLPHQVLAIVMRLLDPDPKTRATLSHVLQAFELQTDSLRMSQMTREHFVGRERELAELSEAFASETDDGAVLVTVSGDSGFGKSELLRRFTDSLEQSGALVLRSRCHTHESVPYKAFDALFDAVSRHLDQLDADDLNHLRPARVRALTRLFPVLRRVEGFETQQLLETQGEPREQRRQGFAAAAELFWRLGRYQRVVLWIDDVQWGDDDSFLLLRELLAPRAASGCWVLLSHRSGSPSRFVGAVQAEARRLPAHRHFQVAVGALSEVDARGLLALLAPAASDQVISNLVSEGAGSPFFLSELARQAVSSDHDASEETRPSLASVLAGRIAKLSPTERELLSVVSVAGGPVQRSVALQACALGEAGRPEVHRLEAHSLLRFGEFEDLPAVETYHDRIREVALGQLSDEKLRHCHRRLADAMELQPAADPEALVRHWLGAGEPQRATGYVILAAERAESALAFQRAAELYATALALGAGPLLPEEVLTRRAQALAHAGHGGDAATCFSEAAEAYAQQNDKERAFDLRLSAAEQYLRSGRTDEGAELMRRSLEHVGVQFPASPAAAARQSALRRMRFLLKGTRPGPRHSAPQSLSTPKKKRLDALWSATTSFSMMTPVVADAFGTQHLAEALGAGDVSRAIRALGYEAVCEATVGGRFLQQRSKKLVAHTRSLAELTRDPYDQAWVHLAEGCIAWCGCDWRQAARDCDQASEIFRGQCRGVSWEQATAELFSLSALAWHGKLNELATRLPTLLNDAIERSDIFAANNFRLGQHSVLWLAEDRPDYARAQAAQAELSWPQGSYHLQRYTHAFAVAQIELYEGLAAHAFRRVEAEWPALEAGQILRLQTPRVELLHLRGRAALALAEQAVLQGEASRVPGLLRLVSTQAQQLLRIGLATATPLSLLLQAGTLQLRGNTPAAKKALTRAAESLDTAGMGLYAAAARFTLKPDAPQVLSELGVRNPVPMARMLIPGFKLEHL